jgi:predicted GIY-YIG superfamily endonuclease
MTEHVLYRFFGPSEELLYVGITMNPSRRFAQHGAGKEWWHEVDEIRMERLPSREAVLAAERRAIRNERPRYNVVHASRPTVPLAEIQPRASVCECGELATVLFVSYAELAAHGSAMKTWSELVDRKADERDGNIMAVVWDMDDIRTLPSPVTWHAVCEQHGPSGDGTYEIPHPTTWREWAGWSAHLLKHEWLQSTDWAQLVFHAEGF